MNDILFFKGFGCPESECKKLRRSFDFLYIVVDKDSVLIFMDFLTQESDAGFGISEFKIYSGLLFVKIIYEFNWFRFCSAP